MPTNEKILNGEGLTTLVSLVKKNIDDVAAIAVTPYVLKSSVEPVATTGTVVANIAGKSIYAPVAEGGIAIETDPVFTTSAAYGITETDITNWNNAIDSSALTPYVPITTTYNNVKTQFITQSDVSGITLRVSAGNPSTHQALLRMEATDESYPKTKSQLLSDEILIQASTLTLNGVTTPVNNTDAANKKYVDDAISAITSTVSSITVEPSLSTGITVGSITLDGITTTLYSDIEITKSGDNPINGHGVSKFAEINGKTIYILSDGIRYIEPIHDNTALLLHTRNANAEITAYTVPLVGNTTVSYVNSISEESGVTISVSNSAVTGFKVVANADSQGLTSTVHIDESVISLNSDSIMMCNDVGFFGVNADRSVEVFAPTIIVGSSNSVVTIDGVTYPASQSMAANKQYVDDVTTVTPILANGTAIAQVCGTTIYAPSTTINVNPNLVAGMTIGTVNGTSLYVPAINSTVQDGIEIANVEWAVQSGKFPTYYTTTLYAPIQNYVFEITTSANASTHTYYVSQGTYDGATNIISAGTDAIGIGSAISDINISAKISVISSEMGHQNVKKVVYYPLAMWDRDSEELIFSTPNSVITSDASNYNLDDIISINSNDDIYANTDYRQ